MRQGVLFSFSTKNRESSFPTLMRCLEELMSQLKEMCQSCGIKEDLTALRYETIAISETWVRNKAGRRYKRIQLKGYKEGRTSTITSWSEGTAPADLYKLVNLYRACKHLAKACDYLSVLG